MKHPPDCGRPLCRDCRALRPYQSRKPLAYATTHPPLERFKRPSQPDELNPELIAAMDAQERDFNRLRDQYGPFSNFGASGDPTTVPRRNSGRRREDS